MTSPRLDFNESILKLLLFRDCIRVSITASPSPEKYFKTTKTFWFTPSPITTGLPELTIRVERAETELTEIKQ